MASTNRTVGDLINDVRRLIGDPSENRHPKNDIRKALFNGFMELASGALDVEALPSLRETATFNLLTSSNRIACPADFLRPVKLSVSYDGITFYEARWKPETYESIAQRYSIMRGLTSDPICWRAGNFIVVSPSTSTNITNGAVLTYIRLPDEWDDDTADVTLVDFEDDAAVAATHYAARERLYAARDHARAQAQDGLYGTKVAAVNGRFIPKGAPGLAAARAMKGEI